MGLTNHQISMIKCLAEHKYEEAREYAALCCKEDKTKRNEKITEELINKLENSGTEILKLPPNITGFAVLDNMERYRADRYYLSDREKELLCNIKKMKDASDKLLSWDIPFLNSILLYGESGTGKTAFGKHLAHCFKLPFLYINFSYLIDSYMGKTGRNLKHVFDFAKQNQCVFMLDEIDCIAGERKKQEGNSGKELANTTITLLQELDNLKNSENQVILLGASNIPETLDPAVKRRFSIQHEVKRFNKEEIADMIKNYLSTLPVKYDGLSDFVEQMKEKPQGQIIDNLIYKIADVREDNIIHL